MNGGLEGIPNGSAMEGVNGGVEEGGAAPAEAIVNGNGINGGEAEAMDTEGAVPAPVATEPSEAEAAPEEEMKVEEMKAEVKDEKPDVSFYKEEVGVNDESLVDEVGAMSDLVQNYFKVRTNRSLAFPSIFLPFNLSSQLSILRL